MIDKKQTLVINLIGGPCAGKSTIAAELFSRLKKMGVHCELVPEYIKELIYEENKTIPQNQIAIFGNQHYMINNKIGKVDCVIQDGSFLNNIIYTKENIGEDNPEFYALLISEYHKFNNLDFFINREKLKFEAYGRIHNEKQSLQLDKRIKEVYKLANANYIEVEARDAVDKIIPIILNKLNYKDVV